MSTAGAPGACGVFGKGNFDSMWNTMTASQSASIEQAYQNIKLSRTLCLVDKLLHIHRYRLCETPAFSPVPIFVQFFHQAHTRAAHRLMRHVNA
jgi:hypothetical protein